MYYTYYLYNTYNTVLRIHLPWHEHVQHSRQEQTAVCDKCASTHNALHTRTPRTLATLQMHQRHQQTHVQCSGPPNDDRHDPHTTGDFAPPGPRVSFTGMRASAPTALGRKARFVAPPVSCCGSYIANPVILADLDVGHAAREAWRRDLSKQPGRSDGGKGSECFRGSA